MCELLQGAIGRAVGGQGDVKVWWRLEVFCWLYSGSSSTLKLFLFMFLQNMTTNWFVQIKVMTDAASVILPIVLLSSHSFIGLLQWPISCHFTICMCERDQEQHMVPRRDAGSIPNSPPGSFILYLLTPFICFIPAETGMKPSLPARNLLLAVLLWMQCCYWDSGW